MNRIERDAVTADAAGADWPTDAAALARLLVGRYSCRGYKTDAVPRPIIERMLTLAQLSASWCNSQPWRTIVTEKGGTERFRKALFDHAIADQAANGVPTPQPDFPFPPVYRGVYKERQREVGWQLYESVGVAFGDRVGSGKQTMENFRLFGAPHCLIVTSERDLGVYGAIDCGIYLGSLMLAAESLGLGMIPQAALATYSPLIHEFFDIPDDRMIVAGASFGYPDHAHPANTFRSRRATLDDTVQWTDS